MKGNAMDEQANETENADKPVSNVGWFVLVKQDVTGEDGAVRIPPAEAIGVIVYKDGSMEFTGEEHMEKAVDYSGFNSIIGEQVVCGSVVRCENLMRSIQAVSRAQFGIKTIDMWIDDEGAIRSDKVVNTAASVLAGDLIYGNVIVMGFSREGETVPLPFSMTSYITRDVVLQLKPTDPDIAAFMKAMMDARDKWMSETGGSGIKVTSIDVLGKEQA